MQSNIYNNNQIKINNKPFEGGVEFGTPEEEVGVVTLKPVEGLLCFGVAFAKVKDPNDFFAVGVVPETGLAAGEGKFNEGFYHKNSHTKK